MSIEQTIAALRRMTVTQLRDRYLKVFGEPSRSGNKDFLFKRVAWRVGHVTRARVTQIMNLLNLAPDIQEALLFLPPVAEGRDPVKEWQVRPVAADPMWTRQRRAWEAASRTQRKRIGIASATGRNAPTTL